jgi:hypothetical protein
MFRRAKELQRQRREAAAAKAGPVLVTIERPGEKKIQVIKVLTVATGLGLAEAKKLLDHPPADVIRFNPEAATALKRELEEAGAIVRLSGLGSEDTTPVHVRHATTRVMRQVVWERDGGRCAECGSTFDLQYDHIIPVAMGGAHTVENLQILCSLCNQRKGKTIG